MRIIFFLNQHLFIVLSNYSVEEEEELDSIKFWLDKKASVNAPLRGKGARPLDWAIGGLGKDNYHLIKILLENQADPCQQSFFRKDVNHFEYFLTKKYKESLKEGIELFLIHKVDPCKLIPPLTCLHRGNLEEQKDYLLPYEYVLESTEMRTLLLNAIPEKYLAPCRQKIKVFLLCMKITQKPYVFPKYIKYMMLGVSPLIKAIEMIKDAEKKEHLTLKEAQKLKHVLCATIDQYADKNLF